MHSPTGRGKIVDTDLIDVNPAFSEITGYEREEVLGKNPRILKSGYHDQAFYAAMWQAIDTTGYWSGELWNRTKTENVTLNCAVSRPLPIHGAL
ncbi:MAG: PAS domain-containing protein [Methylobacter sp.]